jgi:hypothetical protein
MIEFALIQARTLCAGHTIDDRPALAHAVAVAATIDRHAPRAGTAVLAAALLHDSPDFVACADNHYLQLADTFGPDVPRIIAGLHAEHAALDTAAPLVDVDDPDVRLASVADKVVALRSLMRRARASGDVGAFFAQRQLLRGLLGHFRAFHATTAPQVPASLAQALHEALAAVEGAYQVEVGSPVIEQGGGDECTARGRVRGADASRRVVRPVTPRGPRRG